MAPYLPIDRVFGGNAHELSLYVGAVPLMLALWVLVRRSDLGGMKRLAQATAALAVAALLLALGSQGRFIALATNSIPWAAWFQFSCRYTVLFQFAVAVLAAIGFVLVEREAREKQKIQRHLPAARRRKPGCRAVAAVRDPGRDRPDQPGRGRGRVDLAIGPPGGLGAAGPRGTLADGRRRAAGDRRRAGVRGALVGLILFMAADLGYYGLSCTLDDPGASSTACWPRSWPRRVETRRPRRRDAQRGLRSARLWPR